MLKVTVVGAGYVGFSTALFFSRNKENRVFILEIDEKKVELINKGISPVEDTLIKGTFDTSRVYATLDKEEAYKDAEFIIVAVPTDYDEEIGYFRTDIVEGVIDDIFEFNRTATIIIKSTIPIGFTDYLRQRYNTNKIIFSPEFLREGYALYDCLHPSRVIIGDTSKEAKQFAELVKACLEKEDTPILFMSSKEAEAVKLFANAYLAMRISFFNELDTFAEVLNLNSKNIIQGVCLDPRIGMYYNNPSFGFGGYCLPKDTKQLRTHFEEVGLNAELIESVISSNEKRKYFIYKRIIEKKPKRLGFYRLNAKLESDNMRQSPSIDLLKFIKRHHDDVEVVIFEPLINDKEFMGCPVIKDLEEFKEFCDIIVANRMTKDLEDVKYKVYSRDIFKEN